MADSTNVPNMKLWYYPMYRPVRCAWLIYELGIEKKVDFQYVPISDTPTQERKDYHQNVHPHNTVPALQIEGGPTLLESGAMCMYLADLCGDLAPNPQDRAEYYDWIMYGASRLDEALEVLASAWWFDKDRTHDSVAVAKARTNAEICLKRIEERLQTRTYILGDKFTAADCVVAFDLMWAAYPKMKQGELVKDCPNIMAYIGRITARPAWKKAESLPAK